MSLEDGNDLTWNAVAMLDYSLGDRASFYFGYKLLDFDYAEVYTGMAPNNHDVLDQGPFIGFTVRW